MALLIIFASAGSADLAQASAQFVWRAPAVVDHASGLQAISCPSRSLCVATDAAGNVLTSTNPSVASTWRSVQVDSSAGQPCGPVTCRPGLSSLSCPSRSLCVAADSIGSVYATTDPTGGAAAWSEAQIATPDQGVNAVSCPSTSLCLAVGNEGSVAISSNPATGGAAWRTFKIDTHGSCPADCASFGKGPSEPPIDTISCPSTSLCVAGDWDGNVLASTDPSAIGQPWSSAYIDDHVVGGHHNGAMLQTAVNSIACPSSSLCVASDEDGYELVSQEPAAGPGAWHFAAPAGASTTASVPVSSDGPLFGLTCASISLCVGLQGRPNLMALFSPISSHVYVSEDPLAGAWAPGVPDPGGRLEAVSCPTTALCLAVDSAGRVLVGARLTATRIRNLLRSAVLSPARPTGRSLLGLHRLVVRFEAPSAGRVSVRLFARARFGRVQAVLARRQVTAPTATPVTIGARLTRLGEALLRAGHHFRFTLSIDFSPAGGRPVTIDRAV